LIDIFGHKVEWAGEATLVDWDLPRSASSVHLLTRLGEERGLAATDCLAGTGVLPETLLDPSAEVTARQEFDVIRNLLRHCGDEPGLGVEAGRRYHLSLYGVWGLALLGSPSLRATIDVALRYLDLAFAFGQVTFAEDGDQARLTVVDGDIPVDIRSFLVDRVTAGIQTIGQDLYSTGVPMDRVRFRHSAPPDTSRYREVFGVEPEFDADANDLSFASAFLDLPLPQANDWAMRTAEQLCRELVERRRSRTGVAGAVRDLLAGSAGQIPAQAAVAAELHMSARTLFRRLAAEGTSYQALVDEVRELLAEELLCTAGMTTDQISQRLGYAEPACFVRAFKRWKGVPPQTYRASALAGQDA
jgi:AraC-like DNA-binding protein